ncbi:MAG: hypothetical protein ACRDTF_17590 [Pseudonocardiaceae bacterium]
MSRGSGSSSERPCGWRPARIELISDLCVHDEFAAHFPGHMGRVLMVGFTHDPDRLVSAAADGTVRIWSLDEQCQIAEVRVDASLQCAAFGPTAGRLLAGSAAGVTMMTVKSAAPHG